MTSISTKVYTNKLDDIVKLQQYISSQIKI